MEKKGNKKLEKVDQLKQTNSKFDDASVDLQKISQKKLLLLLVITIFSACVLSAMDSLHLYNSTSQTIKKQQNSTDSTFLDKEIRRIEDGFEQLEMEPDLVDIDDSNNIEELILKLKHHPNIADIVKKPNKLIAITSEKDPKTNLSTDGEKLSFKILVKTDSLEREITVNFNVIIEVKKIKDINKVIKKLNDSNPFAIEISADGLRRVSDLTTVIENNKYFKAVFADINYKIFHTSQNNNEILVCGLNTLNIDYKFMHNGKKIVSSVELYVKLDGKTKEEIKKELEKQEQTQQQEIERIKNEFNKLYFTFNDLDNRNIVADLLVKLQYHLSITNIIKQYQFEITSIKNKNAYLSADGETVNVEILVKNGSLEKKINVALVVMVENWKIKQVNELFENKLFLNQITSEIEADGVNRVSDLITVIINNKYFKKVFDEIDYDIVNSNNNEILASGIKIFNVEFNFDNNGKTINSSAKLNINLQGKTREEINQSFEKAQHEKEIARLKDEFVKLNLDAGLNNIDNSNTIADLLFELKNRSDIIDIVKKPNEIIAITSKKDLNTKLIDNSEIVDIEIKVITGSLTQEINIPIKITIENKKVKQVKKILHYEYFSDQITDAIKANGSNHVSDLIEFIKAIINKNPDFKVVFDTIKYNIVNAKTNDDEILASGFKTLNVDFSFTDNGETINSSTDLKLEIQGKTRKEINKAVLDDLQKMGVFDFGFGYDEESTFSAQNVFVDGKSTYQDLLNEINTYFLKQKAKILNYLNDKTDKTDSKIELTTQLFSHNKLINKSGLADKIYIGGNTYYNFGFKLFFMVGKEKIESRMYWISVMKSDSSTKDEVIFKTKIRDKIIDYFLNNEMKTKMDGINTFKDALNEIKDEINNLISNDKVVLDGCTINHPEWDVIKKDDLGYVFSVTVKLDFQYYGKCSFTFLVQIRE